MHIDSYFRFLVDLDGSRSQCVQTREPSFIAQHEFIVFNTDLKISICWQKSKKGCQFNQSFKLRQDLFECIG